MFLTFLSGMFIARILGAEDFGLYGVVVSIAAILAIPSQSGFGNLIIKEVSRAAENKDYIYALNIRSWAKKRSFIISMLIAGSSIAYFLVSSRYHDNLLVYILTSLSVIFLGQNVVYYSYLKGIGRTEIAQVLEALIYPLAFFIGCIVIWFLDLFNLDGSMIIRCLSLLLVTFIGYFIVKYSSVTSDLAKKSREVETKQLNKLLIPFAFSDGLRVAQSHFFLLIVAVFLTSSDAGQFKVAQSLILFVQLPATVLITLLSPEISRLYQYDLISLKRKITRSTRFYSFITFIAFLCAYFFSLDLITLAFGSQYNIASDVLNIICFFIFVSSFFGFGDVILNMIGKGDLVLKLALATFIITIFVSILITQEYGIIGAAYSFGITLLIQRISYFFYARRYIFQS
nr:oligosaccharide flippase family protein [Photobacterium carnosum]